MGMLPALFVHLRGELPLQRLERLRELLELRREGRLDDTQDTGFGYRYLRRDEGNLVVLSLLRRSDTNWGMRLTYQNEPPPAEAVERLREEIPAAAASVGLEVEEVRVFPPERL
jgi:hypothetical protein